MSTDLFNSLSFKASDSARERKDFVFDIKEIDDTGKFTGFASTYGNIDQGGDVVEKGAFTKTIAEHGDEVVILWHHDPRVPIGLGKLEDSEKGLLIHGELDLELPEGKSAYRRAKRRMVKGLSIGFRTLQDKVKDGVRYLKEIRLYEVSLVTFPMNDKAVVTAVKEATDQKVSFDIALDATKLWALHWQMVDALCTSLDSIRYDSGIAREDKITQIDQSLEQFHEQYMEYLPKFLNLLDESMTMRQLAESEHKAGRRLSAETRQRIEAGVASLSQAMDSLRALLEEEADDKSLRTEEPPKQQTTEPDPLHSFVAELNSQISKELRLC